MKQKTLAWRGFCSHGCVSYARWLRSQQYAPTPERCDQTTTHHHGTRGTNCVLHKTIYFLFGCGYRYNRTSHYLSSSIFLYQVAFCKKIACVVILQMVSIFFATVQSHGDELPSLTELGSYAISLSNGWWNFMRSYPHSDSVRQSRRLCQVLRITASRDAMDSRPCGKFDQLTCDIS